MNDKLITAAATALIALLVFLAYLVVTAYMQKPFEGEYMTTKEWLNRARTIDREITALEDARRVDCRGGTK